MGRIILLVFLCLFHLPGILFRVLYNAKHLDEISETKRYQALRDMIKLVSRRGRIKIETKGMQNLPDKNGFMLYPNHQGMYDPLAIMEKVPMPLSIVYKKELDKAPLVNKVLKMIEAKAIDRDDLRQSMQVINTVAEEVKAGRNYVIFAEGTRNKDKNNVHEFKAGSFKIAVKAKCPIVPVALIDAYKVFDGKSIAPVTVKLYFLPAIPYEEYKGMKTAEIAAEVQRRIQETIERETAK